MKLKVDGVINLGISGKNLTATAQVITIGTSVDAVECLLSYGRLAAYRRGHSTIHLVKDVWNYSRTTAKHVTKWCGWPIGDLRAALKDPETYGHRVVQVSK